MTHGMPDLIEDNALLYSIVNYHFSRWATSQYAIQRWCGVTNKFMQTVRVNLLPLADALFLQEPMLFFV